MSYNCAMRLLKRKNGIWYAEVRRNKYRSLRTKDEGEARKIWKQLEGEILREKLVAFERQSTISTKDFLMEYKIWVSRNKAETTANTVQKLANKLLLVLGTKNLQTVSIKDIDKFISFCRQAGNSPVTINIALRTYKAAFNKAVEWEYIKKNPFIKYKLLTYHKRPPAFIEDPADIGKIFSLIGNKRDELLFALLVYTGARRSEIQRLLWTDIRDGEIIFNDRKNYRQLRVPILPRLQVVLDKWTVFERKGRVIGLGLETITRLIKTYLRQAGLGHLRLHDLRHTFASQLIMAGIDIRTVQELLGHSSYKTTEIYAHLAKNHIKQALNKLPY